MGIGHKVLGCGDDLPTRQTSFGGKMEYTAARLFIQCQGRLSGAVGYAGLCSRDVWHVWTFFAELMHGLYAVFLVNRYWSPCFKTGEG